MAEEEEVLRMSRLLVADDIAYRQQLTTAVGEFTPFLCFVVLPQIEFYL